MKLSKWALGIAIISLLVSGGIVVLWICKVTEFSVVSLDSFVGVIVALLAIIVTFVLGWQIYNAIEIKEKVNEIVNLQQEQEKLKAYIEQSKSEIMQANITNAFYHCTNMGLGASVAGDYVSAYRFLLSALSHTVQLQQPIDLKATLVNMLNFANAINGEPEISRHHYDKMTEADKIIKAYKQYELLKEQYEDSYNLFLSKVHVRENTK